MKKEEKAVENASKFEQIEARKQEMESILPNFYTVCCGVKVYSKRISIKERRQGNE